MKVNGYKIEPRANLCGADLNGANLDRADLRMTYIQLPRLFEARWRRCSDETKLQLMRWDCELLPGGRERFAQWVKNNSRCPFSGKIGRGAHFKEDPALWRRGRPKPMIEIWEMLVKDHGIKWDEGAA